MKKKVLVFGDLPIATKITKDLLDRKDVDLLGVVLSNKMFNNNDPWTDTPNLKEFAKLNKIKIFNFNELSLVKSHLNLGFSCRFSRIIPPNVIKKFSHGIINFHGGLLPECGGLYSSCHSILLKHKKGGGTIHYIDKGVDTGNIIKRAEFEIKDSDTSISLFKRTQLALLDAYYKVIDSIIKEKNNSIPQKEFISKGYKKNYFDKYSLDGKKEIKKNFSKKKISRVVRAFNHPNHEPAYMIINGKKKYMYNILKKNEK